MVSEECSIREAQFSRQSHLFSQIKKEICSLLVSLKGHSRNPSHSHHVSFSLLSSSLLYFITYDKLPPSPFPSTPHLSSLLIYVARALSSLPLPSSPFIVSRLLFYRFSPSFPISPEDRWEWEGVHWSGNYLTVALGGLCKYPSFNHFYLVAYGIKEFKIWLVFDNMDQKTKKLVYNCSQSNVLERMRLGSLITQMVLFPEVVSGLSSYSILCLLG